ncbi:LuxR family two component transcriptional regulator [Murinocardiopsis flavida]|uniref:LuxR family two component transcriptional regulator n=1 Tax=Murinocardiopsis flavida TaxID=645275 RepID=A0A2P8D552_9ACTN|nr:response regulator transcription factor [Murinocardiopsis flavida]PSK92340.1 LuxR family two component transcriptional regulator [Murinocardiopsis flavida]
MTIRVILADDEVTVRTGFALFLDYSAPDIEVVGTAADGQEAVEMAHDLRPDVVLMDIRMPRLDGISATRRISALTKVLVLTNFDSDEYVFSALRAGCTGFLLKSVKPERLIEAIRAVHRGEGVLAPKVTTALIASLCARPMSTATDMDILTPRERQVLGYLGHGLSNTQIADRLSMADTTAKTHVASILAKLKVRSRTQAGLVAKELGLTNTVP